MSSAGGLEPAAQSLQSCPYSLIAASLCLSPAPDLVARRRLLSLVLQRIAGIISSWVSPEPVSAQTTPASGENLSSASLRTSIGDRDPGTGGGKTTQVMWGSIVLLQLLSPVRSCLSLSLLLSLLPPNSVTMKVLPAPLPIQQNQDTNLPIVTLTGWHHKTEVSFQPGATIHLAPYTAQLPYNGLWAACSTCVCASSPTKNRPNEPLQPHEPLQKDFQISASHIPD